MQRIDAQPTPAVQPTRPVLRAFRDTPWIRDAAVGDIKLGTVAASTLQFELSGSGPVSQRTLVPQSAEAAALLEGAPGQRVERALRGMLATADPMSHRAEIGGITLARDEFDFAVNSAQTYLENGTIPGWSTTLSQASGQALVTALATGARVSQRAYAQADGWINLGPAYTKHLVRLARGDDPAPGDALIGTWLASGAAHEPQHLVSRYRRADITREEFLHQPLSPELQQQLAKDPSLAMKPINWLEEGIADVLATWAGANRRTADAMGIPALPEPPEPRWPEQPVVAAYVRAGNAGNQQLDAEGRAHVDQWIDRTYGLQASTDMERLQLVRNVINGTVTYPDHVRTLREFLSMAGLDATNPSHFERATALLQDAELPEVPGRIADAILTARGLPPDGGRRDELATAIIDGGAHVVSADG